MALQQRAVDAVAAWEPQTTIAVGKKLGVVINSEPNTGLIIIEKKFATSHPNLVVRLLIAYLQAEYFVATHKELTDNWFAQASHVSKELISKIKIAEPNMVQTDPKKIELSMNKFDFDRTQQLANAMFSAELINQPINIKDYIDLSYLQKAQAEWQHEASNLTAAKITDAI
jgi:ABC-type nitrate/sulfonate/bicarbonate transport system substrate-binding protein